VSDESSHSGSRWEPAPADSTDAPYPAPDRQELDVVAAEAAAEPVRPHSRRRGAVVAAAVAVAGLLVGGAGGYAVGHATAGPGVHERGVHGPDRGVRGPGAGTAPDGTGTGSSGTAPFTAGTAT
jgi:hypothetical protein